MTAKGFTKLKQKQKFSLEGKHKVTVMFGQYEGLTFKEIGEIDPDYLQWVLDTQEDRMSHEIKERLIYWLDKSANFWI